MVRDRELKAWIQRLLGGDFRPDDLRNIFIRLRDRSYGMVTIREIGDFIAHPVRKEKGIVTEDVKHFCEFLIMTKEAHDNKMEIDVDNVSERTLTAILINIKRIDPITIKKLTGLNRRKAEATIQFLIKRFKPIGNGRKALDGYLSQQEEAALRCAANSITLKPTFTDERLCKEFAFALEKNGLLSPGDMGAIKGIRSSLALFAIATLHGTEIALDDGSSAMLHVQINEGLLDIVGVLALPHAKGGQFHVSATFFSSSLKAEHWLPPGLTLQPNIPWDFPIELTPEPKLVPLTSA